MNVDVPVSPVNLNLNSQTAQGRSMYYVRTADRTATNLLPEKGQNERIAKGAEA